MEQLPLGAHLSTPRWAYAHHGIYAGGGRVIHYAGFKGWLRAGPVEEISLAEFSRGRRVDVEDSPRSLAEGLARTIRARSRLGERRYHLLWNNCLHFARWCVS